MSEDIRRRYNHPPETPREEMWDAIVAEIRAGEVRTEVTSAVTDDLEAARRRRRGWTGVRGWVAAAAVLVIGIALGRATSPARPAVGPSVAPVDGGTVVRPTPRALDLAALDHLERSESLLTMVRADARTGRLDPAVATWARSLLVQTRVLLDVRGEQDPALDELLGELELVLIQIMGVVEALGDEARMRTELDLAVGGMDERDVLERIRAAMPVGMAGA
jgi:hypothetical protein